jgi:hypothetical protein
LYLRHRDPYLKKSETPQQFALFASRTCARPASRKHNFAHADDGQKPLFDDAVAGWFESAFAAAWPAIKAGRNVLIAAPTGVT